MELPSSDILAWAVAVALIGAAFWPRLPRRRSDKNLASAKSEGTTAPVIVSDRACAIHLETTGLQADDRVVAVAVAELIDGRLTEKAFYAVTNPGRPSHSAARRRHGLPDEYLARQRPFSEIAESLRDFLGDSLLIGHNVEFAVHMLNAEFRLCGVRVITQEVYCTMTAYHERYPDRRPGLAAAAAALGLGRGGDRPSSIEGALLTARLYQALTGRTVQTVPEPMPPADERLPPPQVGRWL